MADKEEPPKEIVYWKDRHDVDKTFKGKGPYGWVHLVVGTRKSDKKRVLRLKRYQNWFGIPSPEYFVLVQEMLKKGANELGWSSETSVIQIKEETDGPIIEVKGKTRVIDDIPEEIIEFLRNHPQTSKKIIDLVNIEVLDDEDFSYLADLIRILNDKIISAGKKLKLSFQEVLEKIAKEDYKSLDELSGLMDSWSLLQITSLVNILKKRLGDIEMFERIIHDENTYELKGDNSIHRVLEGSMWIVDDKYWLAQSNKSLRTYIGDEMENDKNASKRPDFVCVTDGNKLIIVEIKRPSITLGKPELDQAELYQRIIKKYKGKNYSSIEVILVGNKISEEGREIEGLRRNITLKTYQDFLEDCRHRYQEYLKVSEKRK